MRFHYANRILSSQSDSPNWFCRLLWTLYQLPKLYRMFDTRWTKRHCFREIGIQILIQKKVARLKTLILFLQQNVTPILQTSSLPSHLMLTPIQSSSILMSFEAMFCEISCFYKGIAGVRVFRDVTPCLLVDSYWRLEFHLAFIFWVKRSFLMTIFDKFIHR